MTQFLDNILASIEFKKGFRFLQIRGPGGLRGQVGSEVMDARRSGKAREVEGM